MSTLSDLKAAVFNAIGRDDSIAAEIVTVGVNTGMRLVAYTFEPHEARTKGTLVAQNGGSPIDASELTRTIRLEHVYNDTGACKVFYVPYYLWEVLLFPTTGNVHFYSQYGDEFYYKPDPTGNEQLTVNFLQYPVALSGDEDEYPYGQGYDYTLAFATEYTFAALEETDGAALWERLGNKLSLSQAALSMTRKYLTEEVPYGSNIQGVVEQNTS